MSSAEDSDCSGSGSYSESGSSSESDDASNVLLKPVFVKKSRKVDQNEKPQANPDAVLARAEFQQNLESKEIGKEAFDGVDDTDDVDPEAEFEAWKERERLRKVRDMEREKEVESEGEDDGEMRDSSSEAKEGKNLSKSGAFYNDVDQRLLKRDMGEMADQGDHSRPTRFKMTKR